LICFDVLEVLLERLDQKPAEERGHIWWHGLAEQRNSGNRHFTCVSERRDGGVDKVLISLLIDFRHSYQPS